MSEEELRKNDILFQIDMQLYNEFNDKIAMMNDHLGDIYSLRDVEEVEQAEKEKEIELLREAVKKLQEENKELKKMRNLDNELLKNIVTIEKNYISKDKIKTEIKELEEILEKRKTIDIIEEINRLEELLGE